jgi:hypothetical protein
MEYRQGKIIAEYASFKSTAVGVWLGRHELPLLPNAAPVAESWSPPDATHTELNEAGFSGRHS